MANLSFDEYQEKAWQTAIYPDKGNNINYPILGLSGEAGEVAENMAEIMYCLRLNQFILDMVRHTGRTAELTKKMMRDDAGVLSEERKQRIKKELGDVMWYVQACCNELGILMSDVAQENLNKLFSRKERGKLKGDGDNR